MLQNTQAYLLLLQLHFLFSPFRTDTTVIPGSGTAAGFMWFEASPDKALPKQSGARALWAEPLPQPRGPELGSGPAGTQRSCVNPEQAAGEQPWQTALQEASLDTFPTSGLHSSSDPWPLAELCRFLCTRPFALPTPTLPWWLKFWCYLGPTHHYRVLWWSPCSWLTLTNIMNLFYPCLATIWLIPHLTGKITTLPTLLSCSASSLPFLIK